MERFRGWKGGGPAALSWLSGTIYGSHFHESGITRDDVTAARARARAHVHTRDQSSQLEARSKSLLAVLSALFPRKLARLLKY